MFQGPEVHELKGSYSAVHSKGVGSRAWEIHFQTHFVSATYNRERGRGVLKVKMPHGSGPMQCIPLKRNLRMSPYRQKEQFSKAIKSLKRTIGSLKIFLNG